MMAVQQSVSDLLTHHVKTSCWRPNDKFSCWLRRRALASRLARTLQAKTDDTKKILSVSTCSNFYRVIWRSLLALFSGQRLKLVNPAVSARMIKISILDN
jgi:hypothetical protein